MIRIAVIVCLLAAPGSAGVAQALRMPIVAEAIRMERDVVYCRPDGGAVLADIAFPVMARGLPAILYVHGGRWTSGERIGRTQLYVEEWAKAGYFAMTIDYRLAGSSPQPAGYQDLMCAIRWLHAHADDYGIDEDRIYLTGNSSGGHVVALAATLGDGPYGRVGGWSEARSDVRAVISIAAPYDLNSLSWGNLWTPLDVDDLHQARWIASPIHQVTAATRPMLIIHSDDDQSVPVEQAIAMAAALSEHGIPHRFVHLTDSGHMRLTDEVIREMIAWIEELEAG